MHKNAYVTGVLAGLAWAGLNAWLWYRYECFEAFLGPSSRYLQPPGLQLLLLGVALVVFRFMMVKWDMARTGMGLLFVVFAAVLAAFLNHRYAFA